MNDYILPPEWALQSAVMLTWPHADSDWAPLLADAEQTFTAIAAAIAGYQPVLIVCQSESHKAYVSAMLDRAGIAPQQLRLPIAPSQDSWARDHGPITIEHGQQAILLDFIFNGWGNKYPAKQDNLITQTLHKQGVFKATPISSINLILEGGAIDTDGQGSLLTTESCLLAPTRNPDLSRNEIEHALMTHLGVQRILWLSDGYLEGDDTDGHIDTLARFCTPECIAYTSCEDPGDVHYAPLKAMEQQLQTFRCVTGEPYHLISLPIPEAIYNDSGERLPATYANFLIINQAVLVPTYRDLNDEVACKRLAEVFPHRQIIGIDCRTLIEQGGSLHCVTMQLPASVYV